MGYIALMLDYLWWHYTRAIADLLRNYRDFLIFLNNFFSLDILVKTLFTPWRRLGEGYPDHFDPAQFFSALIVNTLMRITGLVIRSTVIILSLLFILLTLAVFLVILAGWLALPLIIIMLVVLGFALLAK